MIKVFIDSSVLIAALISKDGGSAKILSFCEAGIFEGFISTQVIEEVGKTLKRKIPELIDRFEKLKFKSDLRVLKKINPPVLKKAQNWIKDKKDVHILAAAKQLQVDVLLTLDLRHFIKDPEVAKKSNLQILTPGEFLKGFYKIA